MAVGHAVASRNAVVGLKVGTISVGVLAGTSVATGTNGVEAAVCTGTKGVTTTVGVGSGEPRTEVGLSASGVSSEAGVTSTRNGVEAAGEAVLAVLVLTGESVGTGPGELPDV